MPYDGRANLIPLNKVSKERQKEISRAGGIASAKAKKKRRMMWQCISEYVEKLPNVIPKSMIKAFRELGINIEELDKQQLYFMSMMYQASAGNLKAIEIVNKWLETDKMQIDKDKAELKKLKAETKKLESEIKRKDDDKNLQQNELDANASIMAFFNQPNGNGSIESIVENANNIEVGSNDGNESK